MNRKERRTAVARGQAATSSTLADVADLMAHANQAYQAGQRVQAENICKQILARVPSHVNSLNLLGLIAQASGRHKNAIRMFGKAITADDLNAACHYNIASSYQILNERDAAASHFKKAIVLGLSDKSFEEIILQNATVLECVRRVTEKLSAPIKSEALFDGPVLAAIADDIFLQCALTSRLVGGAAFEAFLTHFRSALLSLANADYHKPANFDDNVVSLFCALAQQFFINEYVFAQSDNEMQQARQLREYLLQKLSVGSDISPLLLAAVAAYFPLHTLPKIEALLAREWPRYAADLLRQQVREPLEEARDRGAIPALTTIDDNVSLQTMQQYEENPYPRWTINPSAVVAGDIKHYAPAYRGTEPYISEEILIAGCGTGQQAIQIAQYFPDARILAVDISIASLAYARRKTREEGVDNIEYAQADILKLKEVGRTFDRIEAVGVLHHLADPKAGWRVLHSLLRPDGIMRVGLYSDLARRSIVEARALIAKQGYRATDGDIRTFRQTILRDESDARWKEICTNADFYSMSGCRDMLFNVMEHRFTIPEIISFLNEHRLLFLGFDLHAKVIETFQRQNPNHAALRDLNLWDAFEAANPQTFWHMYVFSVCKK